MRSVIRSAVVPFALCLPSALFAAANPPTDFRVYLKCPNQYVAYRMEVLDPDLGDTTGLVFSVVDKEYRVQKRLGTCEVNMSTQPVVQGHTAHILTCALGLNLVGWTYSEGAMKWKVWDGLQNVQMELGECSYVKPAEVGKTKHPRLPPEQVNEPE